jgi:hypothetical protein
MLWPTSLGLAASSPHQLLVIGFAGNVHQLARIHVVQDPFRVLAVVTTLHDGQQQLGGVVFQLQNKIHSGIRELKDSFSMRLPENK